MEPETNHGAPARRYGSTAVEVSERRRPRSSTSLSSLDTAGNTSAVFSGSLPSFIANSPLLSPLQGMPGNEDELTRKEGQLSQIDPSSCLGFDIGGTLTKVVFLEGDGNQEEGAAAEQPFSPPPLRELLRASTEYGTSGKRCVPLRRGRCLLWLPPWQV